MPTARTQVVANGNSILDQYNALKSALPSGEVLLMRLGDFYEVLGDDAARVAKALQITLTKRRELPMCGIPFHALDKSVAQLKAAGIAVTTAERSGLDRPRSP